MNNSGLQPIKVSTSNTSGVKNELKEVMPRNAELERKNAREDKFQQRRDMMNEAGGAHMIKVPELEASSKPISFDAIERLSVRLSQPDGRQFTIYNRFGNDFSDSNIKVINGATSEKNVICFYDSNISSKNNLLVGLSEEVIKVPYESLREYFKLHASDENSPVKEEANLIVDQIDLNTKYSKLQLAGKAVDHAIMSDFFILSTLCKAQAALGGNIYATHEHSTKSYSSEFLGRAEKFSSEANDLLVPDCNVFAAGKITEELHAQLIGYVKNINEDLAPEGRSMKGMIGPYTERDQRRRDSIDNYFRNNNSEERPEYGKLNPKTRAINMTTKTAPFPTNRLLRDPADPVKNHYKYIEEKVHTTWANKPTFDSKDQLCESMAASLMFKGKVETLKYLAEAQRLDPNIQTEADLLRAALSKLPEGWTPSSKELIVKTADEEVIDVLSTSVFKNVKFDTGYALRSMNKIFPKYIDEEGRLQYKKKSDYKKVLDQNYLVKLMENQARHNEKLGSDPNAELAVWKKFTSEFKTHHDNISKAQEWNVFSEARLKVLDQSISSQIKINVDKYLDRWRNAEGVVVPEQIICRGGPIGNFGKDYKEALSRGDEAAKSRLLEKDPKGSDTWYVKNYLGVVLDFQFQRQSKSPLEEKGPPAVKPAT